MIHSDPVTVFKTRHFRRWMRKTALQDETLCEAVREMASGLVDADLGGGVVKKRVALAGRGRRGGARVLVATNRNDRWFFVYGFEKSERPNVSADELAALQAIAADLLRLSTKELTALAESGALQEICHDTKIPAPEPDPPRGARDRA